MLAPVAELVRRAGGIFVADEVQSGFARSGERFWGYQRGRARYRDGGQADGKRLSCCGTRDLARGCRIFRARHTLLQYVRRKFGGDSRSASDARCHPRRAAAIQCCQDWTDHTGWFSELGRRYERIGDVRGSGLYIGVELVADRAKRTPDGKSASMIVNALRERRVLISATGALGNVLKIRPPLVSSEHDAARLLDEAHAVIAGL